MQDTHDSQQPDSTRRAFLRGAGALAAAGWLPHFPVAPMGRSATGRPAVLGECPPVLVIMLSPGDQPNWIPWARGNSADQLTVFVWRRM